MRGQGRPSQLLRGLHLQVLQGFLQEVKFSILHSHWSRTKDVLLSFVEMVHNAAPPALLCHKEPAQGTQSPLLGAFLPFAGSLWHKGDFYAQKGFIYLSVSLSV